MCLCVTFLFVSRLIHVFENNAEMSSLEVHTVPEANMNKYEKNRLSNYRQTLKPGSRSKDFLLL